MSRQGAIALALAVAVSACGGARKEARQPSGRARASERENASRGEEERGRGGEKEEGRAGTQERASAPRVPSSPGALLGADTISKAQQALAQRGLLAQHRQGELDSATRVAVRQFQQKQGLAATGVPDKETLRKLGVNAEEGYGPDRGTGSRERNDAPR